MAAYGPGAQATYAGYSVPFSSKAADTPEELAGVVNVAISLSALRDLLNTRFVGRLGVGFLVTRDGVVLASPNNQHVRAGQTLQEVLDDQPGVSEELRRATRDLVAGKSGHVRFKDFTVAGLPVAQSGWLFYEPLEPSDWRMGIAIFDSELVQNTTTTRRRWTNIALTFLALVTLGPLLCLRQDPARLLPIVFNVFGVLGTCGAFFFTIAVMHVDLRRIIEADVITYLESLYLVAYILLLTVTVNSLLLITTDSIAFIEYRDNLFAKLAYWPLLILLVMIVTLFTFY